jgi:membrane-bound metal-dependent hydrolase YbcI (DUF457 family)
MAGFKAHLATSTTVGIGYGAVGFAYGIPLSTCMVASGACSLAGILPDLDSQSGRPVKEIISFTAAMVPALMIPRFYQLGFDAEQIVLAVAMVYLAIRFGAGDIFKRYTVHRGMWHSIPAALVVGLIAFLCVSADLLPIRVFKSAAFVLGFLVHLVLDEIWSLEVRRGRLRIKKSFGTALKLFTTNGLWPNLSTYGKLAAVVVMVIGDPYLMDQIGVQPIELRDSSRQWLQDLVNRGHSRFASDDAQTQNEAPSNMPAEAGEVSVYEPPIMPGFGRPTEPAAAPAERPWPTADDQWQSVDTARTPFYYPAAESPDRR